MTYIDLHLHSNCSDGSLEPAQIIDEAYNNNIKIISITDHDTIDAYSEELFAYAKTKGISLIPGVEISTKYQNTGFHVLGYNIDLNNHELKNKLAKLKNARQDYLKNVCIKLSNLGYQVDYEALKQIDIVTKGHIARSIVANKANKQLLLTTFNHLPTFGEFIETIMNEGCKAYVKKASINPIVASQLIKQAGGIVILAHPVCYKYEDNIDDDTIKQLVKEMEADGIEAIYLYIDCNNNKINEINKWCKFAYENDLLVTIGSDFHHLDNIHPTIGLLNEDINLMDETINKIKTKLKKA